MPARAGPNRIFTDMALLRRTVEALVDEDRYRLTAHAKTEHPRFTDLDRVAVVRWGGRDQPDQSRDPSEGVYLFWARHPRHGLCRGVYAVEQAPGGDIVTIITVMPEE